VNAADGGRLPGVLSLKMRLLVAAYWLLRRWFKVRERARHGRWCLIAAILNRFTTSEMRHAALLLGYDLAAGHGSEGVLGHLREFTLGYELGAGVRYGDAGERGEAVEALALELSMFGTARSAR
jgi:hypothetical protein